MIARLLSGLEVELYKAARQRLVWVGILLAALMAAAVSMQFDLTGSSVSRYLYIAHATPATLNVLGVILLLLFGVSLVAGENARGTLRMLLLRRITRAELFLAKWLTMVCVAVLLALVVVLSAWAIAMSGGNMTGIIFGGEVVFTEYQMLGALAVCTLAACVPLITAGSVALAVSSFSRNALSAALLLIALWFVLEAVKYPLGIEEVVFTTYLEAPWSYFSEMCDGYRGDWTRQAVAGGFVCAATTAAATALGAIRFSTGDFPG